MYIFINIILYLYAFIIGICIGSFLNVVIYRVPLGISIAKGRSFCPICKKQIKNRDLVPIFSWIFLKGKCRNCGAHISIRYLVVELIGGLVAVFCVWQNSYTFKTLMLFAFVMILIAIALIDYDTMTIPDSLVIALIVPSVLSAFVFSNITLTERCIGFFCVSLFLLILTLIIKDSFGGGDIKLTAVAGFFLGYKNILLSLFIAIIITGIYVIIKMLCKKIKKTDHIPFGPGLCMGMIISAFFGEKIISFYLTVVGLK